LRNTLPHFIVFINHRTLRQEILPRLDRLGGRFFLDAEITIQGRSALIRALFRGKTQNRFTGVFLVARQFILR
jgi:hypothetical protein